MSGKVAIREGLRPGDIGRITRLHGELYAREQGWDVTFEAYVAAGLAEFALAHDAARDRIWLAEDEGGQMLGCVAIQGREDGAAQLRWFLLTSSARGRGLGRRLLDLAVGHCRTIGASPVYLWTVEGLAAAAHLYTAAGFRVVESQPHRRWGADVVEQRWELVT